MARLAPLSPKRMHQGALLLQNGSMKTISSLALSAVSVLAAAQSHPSNPVQVSGYLDVYYQHDLARTPHGETLNGRALDTRNDMLSLAFAELDFYMPVAPGRFGFTAMFYAGLGPDIIHLTEPAGKNKYKLIRQGYVTYQTSSKNPVTVDLGKFDTWVGFEPLDNRTQDQYSRSFNTTYAEPSYDTGLRVSSPLSEKLTGTVYLVQGWNEVKDSNKSKSWGVALNYAPNSNTSVIVQNHSGTEGSNDSNDQGYFGGFGFVTPGTSRVDLYNIVVNHQLGANTKLGFSADFGSSSKAPNNGKWNGEVFYIRQQLSQTKVGSLRFDRFEDKDGLRTGTPVKLYSITGAYDHIFSPNFTLRFEARHDLSDNAFFATHSGFEKHRTTLTLAVIAKF